MAEIPKISIVTPSYNQGSFLGDAIRSVVSQNYPRLEYIVVDGGSTDESVRVIKEYEEHIDAWVTETDRGQTHAIRKGLKTATGDLYGWLCADDLLLPGALQVVGEHCPMNGWLIGAAEVADVGEAPHAVIRHEGYRPGDVLCGSYILNQVSVFWSRALYEDVRGLEESLDYAMDWDLWTQFERVRTPEIVSRPLGRFRLHPAQKTASQEPYWNELLDRRAHIRRKNWGYFLRGWLSWQLRELFDHIGVGPSVGPNIQSLSSRSAHTE